MSSNENTDHGALYRNIIEEKIPGLSIAATGHPQAWGDIELKKNQFQRSKKFIK